MEFLGNVVWFIFGGIIAFVVWMLVGILYCITIIGIPFGLQAFKIGGLSLAPFGKRVVQGEIGVGGILGNVIWIFFGGIELAITHLILAIILGITIIGLPFAKQHIKLAGLSLIPFGAKVYRS